MTGQQAWLSWRILDKPFEHKADWLPPPTLRGSAANEGENNSSKQDCGDCCEGVDGLVCHASHEIPGHVAKKDTKGGNS